MILSTEHSERIRSFSAEAY